MRRLGGWLSALLGDLAFTLSDYAGAHIHLSTGARLGIAVGDTADLRETTRHRLAALDVDMLSEGHPGPAFHNLHERLLTLSAHTPHNASAPNPTEAEPCPWMTATLSPLPWPQ